jgi:hypothetical protein
MRRRGQASSAPRNVLRNGFKYEAAQDMAKAARGRRQVGELTAGEQGLSGVYLRNERKAAREAIDAAAKGDLLSAIAFKERQLLNMALFREARDLRGEFEKATDKLQGAKKAEWRAQLGKADPAYRDAHDAILQAIGLQAPAEGQPPPSIDTLLTRATADAQDLDFDTEALRALVGKPKPWSKLSVDGGAQRPRRGHQHPRRGARAHDVQLEGRRVVPGGSPPGDGGALRRSDLRNRSRRGTLSAEGMARRRPPRASSPSTPSSIHPRDARHHARRPRAGRPLPARPPGPEKAARDKERALKRSSYRRLWRPSTSSRRSSARSPELIDLSKDLPLPDDLKETLGEGPVTRTYLWMLALNMGNEGNKQRLLDGYGWTEEQVMGCSTGRCRRASGTSSRRSGTRSRGSTRTSRTSTSRRRARPGQGDCDPVQTPHGEYRAATSRPARTHARRRARSGRTRRTSRTCSARSTAGRWPPGTRRPAPPGGLRHQPLLERRASAPGAGHPRRELPALHPADRAAHAGPRFINLSERYLGTERAKQFVPWLQAVANNQAESVPGHLQGTQRVLGWVRGRAARSLMGGNFASMAKHFLDPINGLAAGLVKPGDVAMAQVRAMNPISWKTMRDFAASSSSELQARQDHLTREVERELKEIGQAPPGAAHRFHNGLTRGAEHVLGSFHEWMDRYVTTISWTSKYTDAQREALKAGTHRRMRTLRGEGR